MLTLDFQDEFLPNDIRRGEVYFRAHRVVDLERSGNQFFADVVGSSRYEVVVTVESSQFVEMECDCPRFAEAESCKHLWATLLAIDERKWGPGDANGRPIVEDRSTRLAKSGEPPADVESCASAAYLLSRFRQIATNDQDRPDALLETARRFMFVVDIADASIRSDLKFSIYCLMRKKDGEYGVPRKVAFDANYRGEHAVPPAIIRVLQQCKEIEVPRKGYGYRYDQPTERWSIPTLVRDLVFAELMGLGDFVWTCGDDDIVGREALRWDVGPAFELEVTLRPAEGGNCGVDMALNRAGRIFPLDDAVWAFADGIILFDDRLAPLEPSHSAWFHLAKKSIEEPYLIPEADVGKFVSGFAELSSAPILHVDEKYQVPQVLGRPKGALTLEWHDKKELFVSVEFDYGVRRVHLSESIELLSDPETGGLILRDRAKERQLLAELSDIPFSTSQQDYRGHVRLPAKHLMSTVEELNLKGWEVRAEGKRLRSGGSFPSIALESNQDWFDVKFRFDFDGAEVSVPALLEALRRNSNTVVLDDGTMGILPAEWLQQHKAMFELGETTADGVRYRRTQAFVIDSLFADLDVKTDMDFERIVGKLKNFTGVKPGKQPRTFQGDLRPYQMQGLGWFRFLQDFGFGGCLADDMGLGKTIQVLALLELRRTRRLPPSEQDEARLPSLVVVPKSLIFNWMDEAAKFTPSLKFLDYTGSQRGEKRPQIGAHDVVVTTYGILRRDIQHLKEMQFDYVILDEAQAIKNPSSQAAKSCRILTGEHRLAMTGTPVENHLGDLWSIFEFLNPGMLGKLPAFQRLTNGSKQDTETLELVRDAISPFVLRRTKDEVLTDLPEKTEQMLLVDMNTKQQKMYDELRAYYRAQLTEKVAKDGLNKSKMHILEALMRLRQAACDPRLLDPDSTVVGAKVAMLGEQLESVLQDGHKALIFSQFTSLLALVKGQLDRRGIQFEYLDGKTQKREQCVKRFQEREEIRAFLISLKAGGHGLNLTAADYVFILDPWWNPATEAQAVDRAHRIGQDKPVVAYRMIAKGTIEEKIMELKKGKQQLAESIVTSNSSVMKDLTSSDLADLFS